MVHCDSGCNHNVLVERDLPWDSQVSNESLTHHGTRQP